MAVSESAPKAEIGPSDGLTKLRYLVSVLVAGLALGLAVTTQLDVMVAGLGLPIAVVGAIVIGLPLALFMRRRGWRRFYHAIGVGFALGFIPALSGASLPEMMWSGVAGSGAGLIAWVALRLQTLPLRFLPVKIRSFATWALAVATLGLGLAATTGAAFLIFGPPASPGSIETVAAFEVPLPSEQDRSQFLILLQREAAAEGLHVDVSSKAELESIAQAIPENAGTFRAAVWRGKKDNRFEASVTDMGHIGFAWINFSRGEDPALAQRFRDRVMRKVVEQWPGTLALPVMPEGAIPLREDLEATPDGYRVKSSAAARYKFPSASPRVTPPPAPGANTTK